MTGDQDLLETIEEIRSRKFPELSADLVKALVLIEQEVADNRQEAYKRLAQAIDDYVSVTNGKKE